MTFLPLLFNRYTLGIAAALALLLGAYWRGHSAGYDSGVAAGNVKAAAAEKTASVCELARTDAEIKNLGWQTQLTEVRNALGAERETAAAQQAQADKAVAAARADADKSAASLKTWTANFQHALATPACAIQARTVLCDAFQSY